MARHVSMNQRLSDLSTPRRALVRLFQAINFGQVVGLTIENGDPVFHPEPTVLVDLKLDGNTETRQEADLLDFELRDEVRKLIAHLDEIRNGRIERIEIRSGIPRRIIIERRLTQESL
jgi:hypothetical protein